MKCGGFNNECLGLGGGAGSRNFPFLDDTIEDILNPSGNITCKVAPDTPVCNRCANKVISGTKIDDIQMEQCSEECRWACTPINGGAAYNVVQFGNRCSKGNMGDLCNNCVDGFYKMNNRCEVCPDNTWVLVGCVFGAMCFGGLAFYLFEKYNVNVAICNIFIDFAQVIAIFIGTDVPWPDELRQLFSYLSVLNFNLVELLGIECSVEISYANKLYMYQISPILCLGVAVGVFLVLRLLACLPGAMLQGFRRKSRNLADNVIGGYLIFFNLLYLSLCRSALDVFNCEETSPSDGFTYMVATHDRCYEEGGEHMKLLPVAGLAIFVYCLGFPICLSLILNYNRKGIEADMKLRAKSEHVKRRSAPSYNMSIRYGRFYKYFRPSCRQWNVVIMFRKFFVASTALLFRSNPTFQLSVALMGMFGVFVLQVTKRPYWSVEEQDAFAHELYERERVEAQFGGTGATPFGAARRASLAKKFGKNPELGAAVNLFLKNAKTEHGRNPRRNPTVAPGNLNTQVCSSSTHFGFNRPAIYCPHRALSIPRFLGRLYFCFIHPPPVRLKIPSFSLSLSLSLSSFMNYVAQLPPAHSIRHSFRFNPWGSRNRNPN
jgi:hypothetical protein